MFIFKDTIIMLHVDLIKNVKQKFDKSVKLIIWRLSTLHSIF